MADTVRVGKQDFLKIPKETAHRNYSGALERLNAIGNGGWKRARGGFSYLANTSGGASKVTVINKATGASVGSLDWDSDGGHIGGFYIEHTSTGGGAAAVGALHAAWTHARTNGTSGPIGTTSLTDWSFRLLAHIYPEWFEGNPDRRIRLMEEARESGRSSYADPEKRADREGDEIRAHGYHSSDLSTDYNRSGQVASTMRSAINRPTDSSRRDTPDLSSLDGIEIPRVSAGITGNAGLLPPTRTSNSSTPSLDRDIAEGTRFGESTHYIATSDSGGDAVSQVNSYFDNPVHGGCDRCEHRGHHLFEARLGSMEQTHIADTLHNGTSVDELFRQSGTGRSWDGVNRGESANRSMHYDDVDARNVFPRKAVVHNVDTNEVRLFASVPCSGERAR
jgi:hypothetical protein